MAGSVNRVILIGNVGKDPIIRKSIDDNNSVTSFGFASFSLATSETWKDKVSGERKEKTEWHKISVFNDRLIEVIEKYITKGSRIYVEGSLQTRSWSDATGITKYTTEIVISKFKGDIVLLSKAEHTHNFANTSLADDLPIDSSETYRSIELPHHFDEIINDSIHF